MVYAAKVPSRLDQEGAEGGLHTVSTLHDSYTARTPKLPTLKHTHMRVFPRQVLGDIW